MNRSTIEGALVMLSLVGVAAPAGHWLAENFSSGKSDHEHTTSSAGQLLRPATSPESLRALHQNRAESDSRARLRTALARSAPAPSKAKTSGASSPIRDPFSLVPAPPLQPAPAPPPLPVVRVIGLVGDAMGGSAMLEIDGKPASIRVGETAYGARLERVEPPDAVVVRFGASEVRARME